VALETLRYAWYSSADVLRLEREQIFARSWQYAGRAAEVAEAGSFVAVDAGGIPLLVVRDRGRQLRAFLNVCRHRGSVLVEGAGRRDAIQCPYHAWTYDLDGTLRAAPRRGELDGDGDDIALVPASVDTWGPFLWVNPDPHAVSLRATLGPLPEQLDPAPLLFHSRVHFAVEANWKGAVENFLECYHCPTAHPAFAAEVDVRPGAYVLERHPTFLAQHCTAKATGAPGQFHLVYPNTGINVFPGPPNLSIGPIRRTAPSAQLASSTTSSPRTPTRSGSQASSRTTTRSAARTRRSSSPRTAG
jgi:phenylpropionate dioxygenase-like ring-hydroxylating dioxygenase large terminal subunit